MLASLLPSILILGLAASVAIRLAVTRQSQPENVAARLVASRALILAIGVQGVHFAEEATTGFHERFGPLFGVPEMTLSVFVIFNLTWIGIWIASAAGLRSARPAAFFAAWFLSIAGMLNALAHPALAIAAGGYFPGLVSSPFIGAAGVWLWLQLRAETI